MCESNNLYHPDNLRDQDRPFISDNVLRSLKPSDWRIDDVEPESVKVRIERTASTGGRSDETFQADAEGYSIKSDTSPQFGQTYRTWKEMLETDLAGALVREWMRYTNARKGHGSNNPLTMEDFAGYIKFWYGTDILA